jgi:hypothetical protein
MLEFYGQDPDSFNWPVSSTGPGGSLFSPTPYPTAWQEYSRRMAAPEEWRQLLTPAQQAKASALLPSELKQAFDWPAD